MRLLAQLAVVEHGAVSRGILEKDSKYVVADRFRIQSTEKSRRRFEGRMNGGGARMDIEGTNGGIQISAR